MMFLLLSVLLNAYMGVVFAFLKRYRLDYRQAIVVNYGICVLTGLLLHPPGKWPHPVWSQAFFPWALLLGSLFISIFTLVGYASARIGITLTQSANKLSLVIPVLFSVLFYHEPLTWYKILAILLALIAVILISVRPGAQPAAGAALGWIPILLFLGSGLIDTLTKWIQASCLSNGEAAHPFLICSFLMAFICGTGILLFRAIQQQQRLHIPSLLSGIAIGIPNYFSIYCLVKALQSGWMDSSALLPLNNTGVLLTVSLCGLLFFRERLTRLNYTGLIFAALSILLMFLGAGQFG